MPWISRTETHFLYTPDNPCCPLLKLAFLFSSFETCFFKFHHDPLEMGVMRPEWKIQYMGAL